ncbi:MAG TPA: hypothetical protein VF808_03070 [Ktedonobacterales bacterium]
MPLTVSAYVRAWERAGSRSALLNRRLIPGTCVLETLSIAARPDLRFIFVDDFGHATGFCRRRVCDDLTPPDGADGAALERWWRMRGAFTTDELASAWMQADAAFTDLLVAFVAQGYSQALGDRLRAIVNTYSLDLEIGEIYVLPQDLPALLARNGSPLTPLSPQPRAKRPFDFASPQGRALLARWLREANQPA